jgi:hypothetical protein
VPQEALRLPMQLDGSARYSSTEAPALYWLLRPVVFDNTWPESGAAGSVAVKSKELQPWINVCKSAPNKI